MERRKIQKVGGSTYTVSVPKHWASENGIEAGAEVCLYTHIDGSLVVRDDPKDGSGLSRAVIDVADDRPVTVRRGLEAGYAGGFETVELRSADGFTDEQRRAVTDVTKRLVGMEVVETGDHRVAVRTLLDAGEVSVRQSVVQSKFVALSMYRTAVGALTGGETADPDRLFDRDDEVDRLFAMVARHFNRALVDLGEVDDLGVDRRELFRYRETARQLERVADHAVDLAAIADRLSAPPGDDLARRLEALGTDARTVVDDATAVVLADAGLDRAHGALDGYADVRERVREIETDVREGAPPADPLLVAALGAIERTAANGANVARAAIQPAGTRRASDPI